LRVSLLLLFSFSLNIFFSLFGFCIIQKKVVFLLISFFDKIDINKLIKYL